MNDLLIAIIPFAACLLMFAAWMSQNRKAAPVRVAEPVRRNAENITLGEADRLSAPVPVSA